jgi:hypothetical protein
VATPADRNVAQKEAEQTKYKSLYRDTATVEHEMCGCTGNNWSHWNGNKSFEEKFGSLKMKNVQQIRYRRKLCLQHHTLSLARTGGFLPSR